jgi:hypothetical protein
MKKIVSGVSCCLLALAGCERAMVFDFPAGSGTLVVNAVLAAGEDSTGVSVSFTRPGNEEGPWAMVGDARVTLLEGAATVAVAVEEGPGHYYFKHRVKPGATYRVVVDHARLGTAWGETTVPSPLEVTIDTVDRNFIVSRWRDAPGERNFYWVGQLRPYDRAAYGGERGDSVYLSDATYTASVLVDPFNRVIDNDAGITTSYEPMARVEDSGREGEWMELSCWVYGDRLNLVHFILSADRNYDAFIKSSLLNDRLNSVLQQLPLFHEPAYTFSNVHGGVGLVASHARVERSFLREFPSREVLLPASIGGYFSGGYRSLFLTYDERRRIVKITGNNVTGAEIRYEDSTSFIVTERDPAGNAGRVTRYKREGNRVNVDGIPLLELDDNGHLKSSGRTSHVTDENGNVTREIVTNEDGSRTVHEFTHDARNGVFKHVKTPGWFIYTRLLPGYLANNRVEERENGASRVVTSVTYNRDDFPRSITRVTGEGAHSYLSISYVDERGNPYGEY